MGILQGFWEGTAFGGLYVHVPFCVRKCGYCDFYSVRADRGAQWEYLGSLSREASLSRPGPVKTIYIGGGTPTSLEPNALDALMDTVLGAAGTSKVMEFTVEANPGTVDREKLDVLKTAGVGRVSLGVQSLVDRELRLLGRIHTAKEAQDAARMISEAGMELSLDLIYGIPGQDMAGWERTLKAAVELRPAHISAYELTPEERTPLGRAIIEGTALTPPEDDVAAMFHLGGEILCDAGYVHYEVSNYALQGHECRHNQNYWRRGTFIGMGPGAHSFDGKRRWWNVEDVLAYDRMLGEGLLPVAECHELSPEEALREEVMLGLRTREGLDIKRFKDIHGLDLPFACAELMHEGLMAESEGRTALTPKGLILLNPVTVRLFISLGL